MGFTREMEEILTGNNGLANPVDQSGYTHIIAYDVSGSTRSCQVYTMDGGIFRYFEYLTILMGIL